MNPATDHVSMTRVQELRTELQHADRARDYLRSVLRDVEWRGAANNSRCPLCGHYRAELHAAECHLAKALNGNR